MSISINFNVPNIWSPNEDNKELSFTHSKFEHAAIRFSFGGGEDEKKIYPVYLPQSKKSTIELSKGKPSANVYYAVARDGISTLLLLWKPFSSDQRRLPGLHEDFYFVAELVCRQVDFDILYTQFCKVLLTISFQSE